MERVPEMIQSFMHEPPRIGRQVGRRESGQAGKYTHGPSRAVLLAA